MNQTAPISQSIKTLWLLDTTLTSLVPGGILYGVLKAGTVKPYATLDIELEGGPKYSTGLIYRQDYRVLIRVWGDQLLATQGTLQDVLEAFIGANTKMPNLTNEAWTLHCNLRPESISEDEQRNLGNNIFIAGACWFIQAQEVRNRG